MNWLKEIKNDKTLYSDLQLFCRNYGTDGLKQAIKSYTDTQKEYVCRTRTSISRININEIYYLTIQGHNISIHTSHGIYQKYGTLNKELKLLEPRRFVKCNQSCIVSLSKIRTITHDHIILITGEKLHMSRKYAPQILFRFSAK